MTERLLLQVNGRDVEVEADPLVPLQSVVHDLLELRSVRLACGVGACGACTVLLGGEPVRSCLVPAALAVDREIVTSEGLPDDHPVRVAFVAEHAYQCGYCIPGFVLSTTALLERAPDPGPAEIDHALAGNLCRCGSYAAIRRAVKAVAAELATSREKAQSGGSADGSRPLPIAPVDEQARHAEHERPAGEHDEAAGPTG